MSEKDSSLEKEQWYWYGSGGGAFFTPSTILAFTNHIVAMRQLPIIPVIEKLRKRDAFFLIAATGLGKTLIIPLWLLARHMHYRRMRPPLAEGQTLVAAYSPRVWVVEPTIAICQGLAQTLNEDWTAWSAQHVQGGTIPLFGCKTSMDNVHTDAPIVFLTTGMFAIYARNGTFRSGRDIVLIDEAHRTLEADESVELGIGICRAHKIDVNYMSATVDASGLETALGVRIVRAEGIRQHVWRHNTGASMEACIVELVRETLVQQNLTSPYVPDSKTPQADAIIQSVFEGDRAKGMLILVNSYASERSQAKRIERLLREAFPNNVFEIGLLASEILRDRAKRGAYDAMLKRWQEQKKRYVLIATSVVEMGVTLPSLDYVVTPDCDFENKPLGVNALIQRIGRVGRERPGIAYITHEVGAPYAGLHDTILNTSGVLAPERIRFPMRKGTLTGLAYLTLQWQWPELQTADQLTGTLPLPSFNAEMREELFVRYNAERARLVQIGVGSLDPPGLTPDGKVIERWIGRADPVDALVTQQAYRQGDYYLLFRSLAACALHAVPLSSICRCVEEKPDTTASVFQELLDLCMRSYHDFVFLRLDSAHQVQELADRVMEFLSVADGRWPTFVRYVAAFIEACDVFLSVNKNGPDAIAIRRVEQIKNWCGAVRRCVDSPFE